MKRYAENHAQLISPPSPSETLQLVKCFWLELGLKKVLKFRTCLLGSNFYSALQSEESVSGELY